ncbi:MAG: hypothetical protein AMXMBFR23_08630 [Chloroflexota bacterium]
MAVQVYRCSHCGREVLVRLIAPMSEAEVSRRLAEEMRPDATGPQHRPGGPDRLRDDIWLGVTNSRQSVPRDEAPDRCPACGRETLAFARVLE